MGISEVLITALVYGVLFLFVYRFRFGRLAAIVLYVLVGVATVEIFQSEKWQINAHSGLPPVSYRTEMILTLTGITAYTVFLLWMGRKMMDRKQKSEKHADIR